MVTICLNIRSNPPRKEKPQGSGEGFTPSVDEYTKDSARRPLNWRKIAISLNDFQKGETKAQACAKACFHQLTTAPRSGMLGRRFGETMPRTSRTPAELPESLSHRLSSYALAASAAGVSLVSFSQPANAKVIYTKTNVVIQGATLGCVLMS
jgi:hypothetical protein